jgi:hypothetical protein
MTYDGHSFYEAEKRQIEAFDEFPEAAAHEDEHRNDTIIRAVSSYTNKGQVLLANSVWHASHLAAPTPRGIQAASLHAGVESSARQYFIRQFQGGKPPCNEVGGITATPRSARARSDRRRRPQ